MNYIPQNDWSDDTDMVYDPNYVLSDGDDDVYVAERSALDEQLALEERDRAYLESMAEQAEIPDRRHHLVERVVSVAVPHPWKDLGDGMFRPKKNGSYGRNNLLLACAYMAGNGHCKVGTLKDKAQIEMISAFRDVPTQSRGKVISLLKSEYGSKYLGALRVHLGESRAVVSKKVLELATMRFAVMLFIWMLILVGVELNPGPTCRYFYVNIFRHDNDFSLDGVEWFHVAQGSHSVFWYDCLLVQVTNRAGQADALISVRGNMCHALCHRERELRAGLSYSRILALAPMEHTNFCASVHVCAQGLLPAMLDLLGEIYSIPHLVMSIRQCSQFERDLLREGIEPNPGPNVRKQSYYYKLKCPNPDCSVDCFPDDTAHVSYGDPATISAIHPPNGPTAPHCDDSSRVVQALIFCCNAPLLGQRCGGLAPVSVKTDREATRQLNAILRYYARLDMLECPAASDYCVEGDEPVLGDCVAPVVRVDAAAPVLPAPPVALFDHPVAAPPDGFSSGDIDFDSHEYQYDVMCRVLPVISSKQAASIRARRLRLNHVVQCPMVGFSSGPIINWRTSDFCFIRRSSVVADCPKNGFVPGDGYFESLPGSVLELISVLANSGGPVLSGISIRPTTVAAIAMSELPAVSVLTDIQLLSCVANRELQAKMVEHVLPPDLKSRLVTMQGVDGTAIDMTVVDLEITYRPNFPALAFTVLVGLFLTIYISSWWSLYAVFFHLVYMFVRRYAWDRVTLSYIPHAVTAILAEVDPGASKETVTKSAAIVFRRLATLPIPASLYDDLRRGTIKVAVAAHYSQDFRFQALVSVIAVASAMWETAVCQTLPRLAFTILTSFQTMCSLLVRALLSCHFRSLFLSLAAQLISKSRFFGRSAAACFVNCLGALSLGFVLFVSTPMIQQLCAWVYSSGYVGMCRSQTSSAYNGSSYSLDGMLRTTFPESPCPVLTNGLPTLLTISGASLSCRQPTTPCTAGSHPSDNVVVSQPLLNPSPILNSNTPAGSIVAPMPLKHSGAPRATLSSQLSSQIRTSLSWCQYQPEHPACADYLAWAATAIPPTLRPLSPTSHLQCLKTSNLSCMSICSPLGLDLASSSKRSVEPIAFEQDLE